MPTKLTEQRAQESRWKAKFLDHYSKSGNVTLAALAAGITRQAAYKARGADGDFASAWEEAKEEATDLLYGEARRRALQGRPEPVFYQGQKVGEVMRYSDYLLWKLLCALRPGDFGDRAKIEHSGPEGGPIQVESLDYIDKQIEQLSQELARRGDLAGEPVPVE